MAHFCSIDCIVEMANVFHYGVGGQRNEFFAGVGGQRAEFTLPDATSDATPSVRPFKINLLFCISSLAK